MDEFLKSRFRVVGSVTVVIICIFLIFFIFTHNKEKKNTALKLKVFYSDMMQATLISKNANGLPCEWELKPGYKNVDILNYVFFNYLKIGRDCTDNSERCLIKNNYKSIDNQKLTTVNLYNFPAVTLNNGVSIAVETVSRCQLPDQICALVYVDLNNIDEPNAFGRDLFVFAIKNSIENIFVPYNYQLDIQNLRTDERFGCNNKSIAPMNCAALIANKGWKIDNSYPW